MPLDPNNVDLFRQARQHAESLLAAGVEWVPLGPPLLVEPANEEPEVEVSPASSCSDLFSEVGNVPEHAEKVVANSLEERRVALKVLAEAVAGCRRCPELAATRTQTVFAAGQAGAEICFIGEAPGADEDAQGEPFVGAAGQLLNKIIAACGLRREDVYICNIIKCRPPGNRTPLPTEAANCRGYLEEQIRLVRPKVIVALGSTAACNLLGTKVSIGKLRGMFHEFQDIPVICTYHPAFLLPHRSPEKKKDVWEDMKKLMARLGKPVK
jgi:DNA polymerase